MGCARDIVESAGVPRLYWSDFPLGHSAGKPHDPISQAATVRGALALFDTAVEPNATTTSPQKWTNNDAWKSDFMRVDALSEAQLAKLKAEHEATRSVKHSRS